MRTRWPTGLRARIVLSTAVVALAGIGLLVGAVWLVLDRAVAANAQSALQDRVDAVLDDLTVDDRGTVAVDTSGARDATVWVFAPDGTAVVGPTGGAIDQVAHEVSAGPAGVDVERDDWLLQARPVPGTTGDVVVVGLPIGGYESTKHLAALVTGLVGLVVVAAIAALVAWTTRRALAPVAGMARDAADWSAADLDRRFALGPVHDEISELGAVLDGLLERAAQAIRSEQRLTAELAHEIRTPLTVIRAEAELVAMDVPADGEPGLRLRTIVAATDSLTGVVETLLAISRGEHARDAVSDVRAVVSSAVATVGGRPGVLVRVHGVDGVQVGAPRAVAAQALAPVLANAVRHATSRVDIRTELVGRQVRVVVEDDGTGVETADLEVVFEPGWQAAGSGSGLGLPLARRVARLAGGDVTLEQVRPPRFVVSLPLAGPPADDLDRPVP
ncbi:sensor histidine kinase [Luteimicrobium subarcticum]|uniref:histidine kinase n=1 Tax=Luteimicrobium subarcticum TaxID=620910 RepID=A0A2M8WUU7_9MICO|nr:HAMP domain-containing sensor histidine kinase [Luteimicrobium subarcticum]PJI94700.1 signal transduction histidine kinase [Luteimicrobium subarcticum]